MNYEEKYCLAFKQYKNRLDEIHEEMDLGLLKSVRIRKKVLNDAKNLLDARLKNCPIYVTSESLS